MGIRLETQLRNLKTAIFNSGPLFLPLPPSNCSKETFYFRGKFIVYVVRASENLVIFTSEFIIAGGCVKCRTDSLARRNLSFILFCYGKPWCSIWALYSGTSLCHSWHGWALENSICSVGLFHHTMPWIKICLASAFSWLSCNSLERGSSTVGCTLTGFYWTWYWQWWWRWWL